LTSSETVVELDKSSWYKSIMTSLMDRITTNPEQCGGRPGIRGMRIRVIDVLDLFAAGLSAGQILEEMPDLEMDDLVAVLDYAALSEGRMSA